MQKIAEKLGFMKARTVKVCTKVVNRRHLGPKIRVFVKNFMKTASEEIIS